jgi:TonB family protein
MKPIPSRLLPACLAAFALWGASACALADQCEAPAVGAPPVVAVDQAVPHGVWRFHQGHSEEPVRCNYVGMRRCTQHRLAVVNESDDTLECDSVLSFIGRGSDGLQSTRSRRVVANRRTRTVLVAISPEGAEPARAVVRCHAREPLPPMAVPPGCAYKVVQSASFDAFYPEYSRRAGEQGPVDVEFTLLAGEPRATAIAVVGSSLWPMLDEAAMAYVGALRFEAPCPSTRFRLKMEYRLSD